MTTASMPAPATRLTAIRRLALSILAGLAVTAPPPVRAQSKAEAARPPLSIAIFVSSRSDLCFDPGDVTAITRLATREQDSINDLGGIAGRAVNVRILDDERDPQRSIANVRSTLADPQTVAMIGLSNSTRAKAVFDALGQPIEASAAGRSPSRRCIQGGPVMPIRRT